MPQLVLAIANAFSLAVKLAPEVSTAYQEIRKVWDLLFSGGLITLAQQQELYDWANAHEAAVLGGQVPPELKVEPDPQ